MKVLSILRLSNIFCAAAAMSASNEIWKEITGYDFINGEAEANLSKSDYRLLQDLIYNYDTNLRNVDIYYINKVIVDIRAYFPNLRIENTFHRVVDAIKKSLLMAGNLFVEIIDLYKTIEQDISSKEQREVQKTFVHSIMNDTHENQRGLFNILFENLPKSFNEKFFKRLLYSIKPFNENLKQTLLEKTNKKPIRHTEILSMLWDNSLLSWKEMQDIIERATPAAKNIMKRVIFRAGGENSFILDETLQPMNIEYDHIDIDDNANITLIRQIIDDKERKEWARVFNDFKIVPVVDYFGE